MKWIVLFLIVGAFSSSIVGVSVKSDEIDSKNATELDNSTVSTENASETDEIDTKVNKLVDNNQSSKSPPSDLETSDEDSQKLENVSDKVEATSQIVNDTGDIEKYETQFPTVYSASSSNSGSDESKTKEIEFSEINDSDQVEPKGSSVDHPESKNSWVQQENTNTEDKTIPFPSSDLIVDKKVETKARSGSVNETQSGSVKENVDTNADENESSNHESQSSNLSSEISESLNDTVLQNQLSNVSVSENAVISNFSSPSNSSIKDKVETDPRGIKDGKEEVASDLNKILNSKIVDLSTFNSPEYETDPAVLPSNDLKDNEKLETVKSSVLKTNNTEEKAKEITNAGKHVETVKNNSSTSKSSISGGISVNDEPKAQPPNASKFDNKIETQTPVLFVSFESQIERNKAEKPQISDTNAANQEEKTSNISLSDIVKSLSSTVLQQNSVNSSNFEDKFTSLPSDGSSDNDEEEEPSPANSSSTQRVQQNPQRFRMLLIDEDDPSSFYLCVKHSCHDGFLFNPATKTCEQSN